MYKAVVACVDSYMASEGGEKKIDASAKMICVACFISTMQKTTTYKFTFALCANVTKIRDDIAPYNIHAVLISHHSTQSNNIRSQSCSDPNWSSNKRASRR